MGVGLSDNFGVNPAHGLEKSSLVFVNVRQISVKKHTVCRFEGCRGNRLPEGGVPLAILGFRSGFPPSRPENQVSLRPCFFSVPSECIMQVFSGSKALSAFKTRRLLAEL